MRVHEFQHEMAQTSGVFGRVKDAYVTFSGDGAHTDGKRINIPALPTDAELTPMQVSAFRGYVDHESGHLRHSNMPLLMKTYKKWVDSGYDGLKNIQNCVEDIWLESKVMREYPGSAKNLRAVTEYTNDNQLPHLESNKETYKEVNVNSACLGITSVGRESYKARKTDEVVSYLSEEMITFSRKWSDLAREAKNTEELIELAKAIHKLLREDPNLESDPEDFDPQSGEGEGEGDGSDAAESGDQGGGQGIPDALGKMIESLAKELDSQVPGNGIKDRDGRAGDPHKVLTTAEDKYATRKNPQGYTQLSSGNVGNYEKTKTSIQSHILVMKNKLKRSLLAKEMRDWDFGREHGKLDSKRLVQGYMGSQSIYKMRTERLEEDTAVLFLVDLSGSMCGVKIDRAQEAVIALSECLEGTSISYSIVGFGDVSLEKNTFSYKYHRNWALHMLEFKGFESSLRSSKPSIGAIHRSVLHHNSDPCAIKKSIDILQKRPEKRKVLVTLSDGRPATITHYSSEELVGHATASIKYGTKKGVQSVGIGIMDDTVKRIYPDYIVIKDVKDLANKSFKKLTDILLNKGIQK